MTSIPGGCINFYIIFFFWPVSFFPSVSFFFFPISPVQGVIYGSFCKADRWLPLISHQNLQQPQVVSSEKETGTRARIKQIPSLL